MKYFSIRTEQIILRCSLFFSAFGIALSAQAQWTAVSLHPSGATASGAFAGVLGQRGGNAVFDGVATAGIWSSTPGSFVSLNPTGASSSSVWGMSGAQQAGSAVFDGFAHAGTWSGTAGSWNDLNPLGSAISETLATDGIRQGGYTKADASAPTHAAFWTGNAGSWVDYNLESWDSSMMTGVVGFERTGWAMIGGLSRAISWININTGEYFDLTPSGTDQAAVLAASEGEQVGWASVNGQVFAGIWRGTEGSFVSFQAPGSQSSILYGTAKGLGEMHMEVGSATFSGAEHAIAWGARGISFRDLHSYLPSNYSSSRATSVVIDGLDCYITGFAFNNTTGQSEAILWAGPTLVPEPGTIAAIGFGLSTLVLRKRRKKN